MKTAKRYWVKIIHDDGTLAFLINKSRSQWTKRTAMKYADDFFKTNGLMCYIIEA